MKKFLFLLVSGCLLGGGLFSLSTCTTKKFTHLDTVACPVNLTLSKIKIADRFYNQQALKKTKSFYELNQYKMKWLEKKGPMKIYDAFIKEVKESNRYGMDPDAYGINELSEDIRLLYKGRKRITGEISNLDMRITAAFFLFTTHLLRGRILNPGSGDFVWKREAVEDEDISLLLNIDSSSDLRKEIDKLHPADPQYEKLRKALKQYRDLETVDLPAISIKSAIHPGDSANIIPEVRRRLSYTDLKNADENQTSTLFDEALASAVKQFQQRHGLTADGILNTATAKYLSIPFYKIADRIELNLERLRWQPHTFESTDEIIINVPEYLLRVYRNKRVEMEMKVVLGTDYNATPIFSDTIKYIVFSPTWNIPKSILEEEMLPLLRENPDHFSDRDYIFYKDKKEIDPSKEKWDEEDLDIESYKVVQVPGNGNALGNVKFVMPNDLNIYLHDTPADYLFSRKQRAYSHGCIRLEKPVDLALYLLNGNEKWNKEKVAEAMLSEEPINVTLEKPLPVHIVYRTVWVEGNGLLNLRDDIYGHDDRQIVKLKRAEKLVSGVK